MTLRKHSYSNILKISAPEKESFQIYDFYIFHISAQKHILRVLIRTVHRGGPNKFPQSMFLSRNKKSNVYSCKLQFYYIKVGFKEVKTV